MRYKRQLFTVLVLVLLSFSLMMGFIGCGGDSGGGGGGDSPTLTSIAVTPANPSITVGATQQFTATGTYSDSSTQNITSSVTWNSSDTSVATINNTGLTTAVASGSTTVTASSGSLSGTTTLTVTSGGTTSGSLIYTVTRNPSSSYDFAYKITKDTTYMYIGGVDSSSGNYQWRIEKRNLSDGSLSYRVTSNPTSGDDYLRDIAIDSNYMYIVGHSGSGEPLRIEKRNLSDGSLVTSFGTNGAVTSDPYGLGSKGYSIAIDSTYMYVVGYTYTGSYSYWLIEKRNITDGSLVSGFGTSGRIISNDIDTGAVAYGIAIDSTNMYVIGDDGGTSAYWRIEKRNLSDGARVTSFGTNGVITSNPSTGWDVPNGIAIDSAYMYVVGYENLEYWRIEKRSLTNGSLVTSFGTNGAVTSNSSTGSLNGANGIAIDSNYMYVVGSDDSNIDEQWRIEKRELTNGSLVTSFGTNGVVTSDPSSSNDEAQGIIIDSSYLYIIGYDQSRGSGDTQWRIEKRVK